MAENKNNLPNHIAIIPDGNRRWARQKGLKPWEGHEEGAKNIEKLIEKAFDLGVKNISFWGSSMDNLQKRPMEEKRALLGIYERYFKRLIESEDIHKNQAKINVVGRWKEQFPASLRKLIEECIDKTKDYANYSLNFFLAYSGDDEMLETVKVMVEKFKSAKEVTRQTIKENLMTRDLPEVDYMIRTGGEPHLSAGFMMWDTANAQLYFSESLFPNFNPKELEIAIEDFKKRGRRLGK